MDARAGDVEVAADKRLTRADFDADFTLHVLGDFGHGGQVHAVERAAQGGVLNRHGFQRAVARAFADAQQRAVDRRAAVHPRRTRVADDLVEVVVAMPFQLFRRYARIVVQTVDDAGDGARQGSAIVMHAVAHRVAGANLNRQPGVLGQVHQFFGEGKDEAVEISTGDVLEVAARADAAVKCCLDDAQILVYRLFARQVHLLEDVVVRAGDEDARFLHACLLDQLEVLLVGANPRRDFGEIVAEILAGMERFLVLIGVQEEFGLANQSLRAAQTVHQRIQVDNLLDRERADRLLTVAEGGIGHPDFVRHVFRHMAHVECNLRDGFIVVQFAIKVRLCDILQAVLIAVGHQQV